MSHCFKVALRLRLDSLDHFYISLSWLTPKSHPATCTQLGAEDTRDEAERNAKWPPVLAPL